MVRTRAVLCGHACSQSAAHLPVHRPGVELALISIHSLKKHDYNEGSVVKYGIQISDPSSCSFKNVVVETPVEVAFISALWFATEGVVVVFASLSDVVFNSIDLFVVSIIPFVPIVF